MFAGPDGLLQRNSTCRKSIPSDAMNVQDQLVTFDYATNVLPGSNATLALMAISLRLQGELSQLYLDCNFDPGSDFYTYAVSSLPPDRLGNQSCSDDEAVGGYECYTAHGAFTATIFYLPEEDTNRRRLVTISSTISDPNVLNSFSSALEDIFSSDALTGEQVMSTTYGGEITNAAPPESSRNVGAIAGGVIGGVAVATLLAVALYAGMRRQSERKGYTEKIGDGSGDQKLEQEKDDEPQGKQRKEEDEKGSVKSNDEDSDEEKQEVEHEEDFNVIVVNDEEETFASMPVRRPVPLDLPPDDEPQPPRFISREELNTPPRVYSVSDTVGL